MRSRNTATTGPINSNPARYPATCACQAMERWLEEHEYESLAQARGSLSLLKTANATAYERGNYMKILQSWSPA